VTVLPALKVVRPALLRPWREAVWRDQDYRTWLLIVLGVLLAIRLLGVVFAETDLFFDEAQYWSWSRDLAFGYFSKPGAVAHPAPTILVTAELLRQAKSVLTDNRDVTGELLYYLRDSPLPITVWYRGEGPRNHFEMTRPFTKAAPEPAYVTLNRGTTSVPKRCYSAQVIGEQQFPIDALPMREGRFYLLKGYECEHAD
jgi:hypothetical protein